jgi:hypothetical protein
MPITITKAKSKAPHPKVEVEEAQTLVPPSELTWEELADRYGVLNDQVTVLKANPIFGQFEVLQAELAERLAKEFQPVDSVQISGKKCVLEIGAAAKNPSKIKDMAKLFFFLGQDTFLKLAKMNLTDVSKYCTPDQVKDVVSDETGYSTRRKINVKYI